MDTTTIIQVLIGGLVTIVGWFLKRSVDRLDSKLDMLTAKDSSLEIQITEVRVRLAGVEMAMARLMSGRDA